MSEVLDLFSAAAGGWSLGMHRAGFKTIAACENVDWRRALYAQNNPGVVIYDDVCTLKADRIVSDLGRLPSIVVGSPPCQDISSANTKGKGVEGARSGLYFEAIRIIGEVRPRWFALENSANLRTRGADAVLAALEAIGYTGWAFVVSAGDVGANHERKRSWIIGCDLAQVADPDGLVWDAGWQGRRRGLDISVSHDPRNADIEPGAARVSSSADEGQDAFSAGRLRQVAEPRGDGPLLQQYETGNASGDGCGQGRPWGRAEPVARLSVEACGDAAGNPSDADETRQEAGLLESSLRSTQEPDDGRGVVRRDDVVDADSEGKPDGAEHGEVGWSEGSGGIVAEPWSEWNSGLAGHLRVDDGLSAWVAQSRIAVGGPRGTVAASLIVEAFGDSVLPQIPEAIGRAILRTEAALASVYARAAA